MEAILVALITGGLSLLGVVITNMMAARRAEREVRQMLSQKRR